MGTHKRSASLGTQVSGPTLELAALVKKALEIDGKIPVVETDYGVFHISRIELMYSDNGDGETVGFLVPDEGEGDTLDFWTPEWEETS